MNIKKKCNYCGKFKSILKFDKVQRGKFGVRATCKECRKLQKENYYIENREMILINQKEYKDKNKDKIKQQSKKYKIDNFHKVLFNSINQRCNNPKSENYKYYGLRDIKNKFKNPEEILYLMEKFNFWELKNPSIDRKDKNKHYCIQNCQFIEFGENSAKDKRKAVMQFHLNGDFIREFISVAEANRFFNKKDSHIQDVANKNRKSTLGFKWEYKNE